MNPAIYLLLFDGDGEGAEIFPGPFRSEAWQAYSPGSVASNSYSPGSEAGQAHSPGSQGGQGI